MRNIQCVKRFGTSTTKMSTEGSFIKLDNHRRGKQMRLTNKPKHVIVMIDELTVLMHL